jgi:hypothetical protein
MDRAQRRQFVLDHRTCIFGYNRKDDAPAMTVVYYVLDGEDILISTMAARSKPYATFATPPRHVYKPEDIDSLTHSTSSSLPW